MQESNQQSFIQRKLFLEQINFLQFGHYTHCIVLVGNFPTHPAKGCLTVHLSVSWDFINSLLYFGCFTKCINNLFGFQKFKKLGTESSFCRHFLKFPQNTTLTNDLILEIFFL